MNTFIKIKTSQGTIQTIPLQKENIDWELVETDEREMGIERLYEYTEERDDIDGSPITITLRVWEYPEGVFNDDEIEVDGAKLVKKSSLSGLIELL